MIMHIALGVGLVIDETAIAVYAVGQRERSAHGDTRGGELWCAAAELPAKGGAGPEWAGSGHRDQRRHGQSPRARPESDVPRDDEFSAGPYDLSTPPDWEAFPGLYPPLYTQTPDVFFDWVAPFLPEIELRVLLYLIRRTLGFKKQGDQITVEQIACGIVTREGTRVDWGAQIGERSVQRALSGLEAKGLIERHRQLDPERGWRPSYIRLRLCDQDGQSWAGRGRQAPPPGVSLDARGMSAESPPSRTTRHLPGGQAITPDHRA